MRIDAALPFGPFSVKDSFDRPDNALTLGPKWVPIVGTWAISGNCATMPDITASNDANPAYYQVNLSSDQYCKISYEDLFAASSSHFGCAVRLSSAGSSYSGYGVRFSIDGFVHPVRLLNGGAFDMVGLTAIPLGGPSHPGFTGIAPASSGVLELRVQGTVVSIWADGTQLWSFDDVVYQTANPVLQSGKPGIIAGSSWPTGAIHKWEAGNLSASIAANLSRRPGKMTNATMAFVSPGPIASPALATDTFIRADSSSLGTNWTDLASLQGAAASWNIFSNGAYLRQFALSGINSASYTAITFNPDQFVRFSFNADALNNGIGVGNFAQMGGAVRLNRVNAQTLWDINGYGVYVGDFGVLHPVRFAVDVAGGVGAYQYNELSDGIYVGRLMTNTDVVELKVIDTTFSVSFNGVQLWSFDDSAWHGLNPGLLTAGYPGLVGSAFVGRFSAIFDWKAGNAYIGFNKLMAHSVVGVLQFSHNIRRLIHRIFSAGINFFGLRKKRYGSQYLSLQCDDEKVKR
jgi:hypothetical protein